MHTADRLQPARRGFRRTRVALLTTCLTIMVMDVAGAERALGAGNPHGASLRVAAVGKSSGAPATARAHTAALATELPRARATTTSRQKARPAVARITAAERPPAPARPAVPVTPPPPPPTSPAPARAPLPVPAPAPAPRPAPAPAATPTTTTPPPPPPAAKPPATADPSTSVAPSQAFQQACWVSQPDIQSCDQAALADIDNARAREGLDPLQLPAGYYSMSVAAQLVAVADAERISRGLPSLPENSGLDRSAQQGAASGQDPTGPSGYTWDSNYAVGDPTALAADFSWMYDDGPGSGNVDCTATNDSGCWGHRHNILSPWPGSAGGGEATYQGRVALAQLFVEAPQG